MSTPTKQAPTEASDKAKAKRRNNRELARSGGIVVLAVLIVAFAVSNLRDVKVEWIFGSGHAPLIVVIVISLIVGIVLTHFADRFSRWRR